MSSADVWGIQRSQVSSLTPDFIRNVQEVLQDPGSLPPEFKNWVTQWIEAFPPLIPLSQISGYANATTYAEVTTPGAVASGTSPVAVAWTAKRKDASAMWATGSNTKLTCKQAGVYKLTAFLDWGTNTTGVRLAWIRFNGSTLIGGNGVTPTAQGSPLTAEAQFDLQTNDFVEVVAVQNSGGNLTPTGFFSAVRVSPT